MRTNTSWMAEHAWRRQQYRSAEANGGPHLGAVLNEALSAGFLRKQSESDITDQRELGADLITKRELRTRPYTWSNRELCFHELHLEIRGNHQRHTGMSYIGRRRCDAELELQHGAEEPMAGSPQSRRPRGGNGRHDTRQELLHGAEEPRPECLVERRSQRAREPTS